MIEAILFGGSSKVLLRYSGPGNKQLVAGDKHNGWLGLIDTALMPTLQQVAANAGLTVGAYGGTTNTPPFWLKAVINDKFIFVPNGPWSTTVNWAQLYNAGLVYGTDDTGPGKPLNLTGVNQLNYFEWKAPDGSSWLFKVRLLQDNVPVSVGATSEVTTTTIQSSEQFTLFSHLFRGGQPVDNIKWDDLTNTAGLYPFQTFGQTVASNGYIHTFTSNGQPDAGYFYAPTGVSLVWLPVLEVVSPEDNLIFALSVQSTRSQAIPVAATATSIKYQVAQDVAGLGTPAQPVSPSFSSSTLAAPGDFRATNANMYSVAPTASK